jgi:putative membrane protein insertion efficiency factor
VLARALIAAIRFYRTAISPLTPPACRFYPTCSAYGLEAIERWGAARGTWLTVRRLARCQPFCKGGYDPVPLPPGEAGPHALRGTGVPGRTPTELE